MIQLTALRLTFSPCPNREAVAQRRASTQARHGVLYAVWLLMPSNQFLPQFDRCFVRICKKLSWRLSAILGHCLNHDWALVRCGICSRNGIPIYDSFHRQPVNVALSVGV